MDYKRNIHPLKILIISLIALVLSSPVFAGALLVYPKFMALDSDGSPLVGGKLYTYEQGTTTPKTTYSDRDLETANANPIILDSRGEATVYGSGYYKFVLKDSDDTSIWTFDEILAGSAVDWISISDYGNSLASAVSDIGSTPTTLLIDQAITVSDNVTVPANVNLWVLEVENGAIQVDSGKTITYNCSITAGSYQIFGGSGTHTTTGVVGHYDGKWVSSGNHHVRMGGVVLPEQSTVPTTAASQGAIYTKDTNGQPELFFREESNGDEIQLTFGGVLPYPRGWIGGLKMSNDTDTDHDILVAVGSARDSTDAVNLTLSTAMTKQIDAAWAAGDDAGGLFSGSVGNTTWYHMFLIKKDSDGTIDAGFDTSISAANIPEGYTYYRRIGSVLTNGSANIIQFWQNGDRFEWLDPPLDIDVATQSTTAVARTLSVPSGLVVQAHFNYRVDNDAGDVYVYFRNPNVNDEAPSNSAGPLCSIKTDTDDAAGEAVGPISVFTNTSSQITTRSTAADTTVKIATLGWTDSRGKND